MANLGVSYDLSAQQTDNNGVTWLFVSKGDSDVIKVVRYEYVEDLEGRKVYNLGFGDYDYTLGRVVDNANTNNGDARKVLYTVLGTVPVFFELFPDSMLIVQGSDSRPEFKDECRRECTRNCKPDKCLKFNQRIRVYRRFIDAQFASLNSDYEFFGGFVAVNGEKIKESYAIDKDYLSVLLVKRNM